jgi:hypothetical protein
MQKLKAQLINKCIAAIFIIVFITPSVVKLIDAFQTHSIEICKVQQTHLHKQSLNCELCKINFNHVLHFQLISLEVTNSFNYFQSNLFYQNELHSLNLKQRSLRGPPQLI